MSVMKYNTRCSKLQH